jgi:hypothetical protein
VSLRQILIRYRHVCMTPFRAGGCTSPEP